MMSEFGHLIEVCDDGLEPAEYAQHTLEKLSIVNYYLQAFDNACKRTKRYGGWIYVDSFSGSGHVRVRSTDRVFEGSALIGLRSGASSVIAIECDARRANVLGQRLAQAELDTAYRIKIGDANEVLPDLVSEISPRTPMFVFHDPEGTELSWQTVRTVATASPRRRRKPEQLINFTAGVLRLLSLESEIPASSKLVLDRFFGNSDWVNVREQRLAGWLEGHETLNEMVELYKGRLKRDVGYNHVLSREIRRENVTRGQLAYHLVFASDHSAAPGIMEAAFSKEFVGQLTLDLDE